jgi:hypothetical protein
LLLLLLLLRAVVSNVVHHLGLATPQQRVALLGAVIAAAAHGAVRSVRHRTRVRVRVLVLVLMLVLVLVGVVVVVRAAPRRMRRHALPTATHGTYVDRRNAFAIGHRGKQTGRRQLLVRRPLLMLRGGGWSGVCGLWAFVNLVGIFYSEQYESASDVNSLNGTSV